MSIPNKKNKNPFYLVLAICITALSLAGFITLRNAMQLRSPVDDTPENQTSEYNYSHTTSIPSISDLATSQNSSQNSANTIQGNSSGVTSSKVEENDGIQVLNPEKVTQPSLEKYILPLQGNILVEYSPDTLVFSKTMNDWRTHAGIDIAGNVGTKVQAANAGKVEKIFEDAMMGWTVEIKHSDGVTTRYCNLSPEINVKLNQTVKLGATIGGIGESAIAESAIQSHLHFEAIKDEKPINPKDLTK